MKSINLKVSWQAFDIQLYGKKETKCVEHHSIDIQLNDEQSNSLYETNDNRGIGINTTHLRGYYTFHVFDKISREKV